MSVIDVRYIGESSEGFTHGKVYESALNVSDGSLLVTDDVGKSVRFEPGWFMTFDNLGVHGSTRRRESAWLDGVAKKFCGVIKREDAVKYLNDKEKYDFHCLCNKIEMGRKRDGKHPVNAYLVINVDEPYAKEVADILKRHGHWG
ncbi:hypothetical protein [Paenibacillus senegalimassiliensis]|uniref:hypothetical protein n=1 Tax=Paenibacillus senegalimassiliensis TaxID=1737426 RepID=UPI00073F9742|nr:hypothetical protein [Paenibacillus senegalimassiliensis]